MGRPRADPGASEWLNPEAAKTSRQLMLAEKPKAGKINSLRAGICAYFFSPSAVAVRGFAGDELLPSPLRRWPRLFRLASERFFGRA